MIYKGIRDTSGTAYVVKCRPGRDVMCRLGLKRSLKVWNHSPAGFEWGYGGSGPAQLALALLLDVTGDRSVALANYQDFKWQVVANFDRKGWELPASAIRDWLKGQPGEEGKESGGEQAEDQRGCPAVG